MYFVIRMNEDQTVNDVVVYHTNVLEIVAEIILAERKAWTSSFALHVVS